MSELRPDARRDAYKVLQVDPEADLDVIQAADRRLAQKFHPDRVGGSETPEGRTAAQRMVAINVAWELLRDPARRAAYDRERVTGTPPHQPPPGRPAHAGPVSAPPAGSGGGSTTDRVPFGRYAGSTLEEILRADPGYLEWLARTPAGRPYRAEIETLLRRYGRASTVTSRGLPRR